MCSPNNFFWNKLEKELSIEIPSYIKHGLNLAQFGNPLTFKHVNDTDICDVERLIRHKMLEKIERDMNESMSGVGDADDLLIDDDIKKEYFGDVYFKDPNNFEFLPGDLKLIRLMVEHVQTNVDANGINKGLGRYTQKKKTKFKCKPTLMQPKNKFKSTNPFNMIDEHNSNNSDIEESETELSIQFKSTLFTKILQCMKSYGVDEHVSLENVPESIVSVSSKNDQIYGQVDCIICKNDSNKKKPKPKSVSYQNGSWIASNFTTHLKKVHKLCDENRSSNKTEDKFEVSDKSSISIDQNNIDEIELMDVIVVKEDMHQMWYAQISTQITKMAQNVLFNGELQCTMRILLTESDEQFISVVPSTADGNCMFSSLSHQLFGFKMNSSELKAAHKQMRADVVQHIKKNYTSFKHELKGRVYERRDAMNEPDSNGFDVDKECVFYLNQILPQNRAWGGAETLKAVSNIYKVNIIMFYEEGPCRVVNDQFHDKTICVAYRVDNTQAGLVRNHYDSVSDIESDAIYALVQQIIKQ